jgi:hypothetical protein
MCHHRRTEYTRLYEDSEEHEDLPEWALEEEEADAEADEEPLAPGTAD